MSVYKRKNQKEYAYDFIVKGVRFSGNTGEAAKARALEAEKRIRQQAEKDVAEREVRGRGPMSFGVAATQYYVEVGQHASNQDNMLYSLEWLKKAIGPNTLIKDIDNKMIAGLIVLKRGEKARGKVASNAQINRSVTEPLKRIIRRSFEIWDEPVPKIMWKEHKLKEHKKMNRPIASDEEMEFFNVLRADYHDITSFAIISGMRRGEFIGLKWSEVDLENSMIRRMRKGGDMQPTLITPSLRVIIVRQIGNHKDAVFTYVAQKRNGDVKKGQRVPITKSGYTSETKRAYVKAGIKGLNIHSFRHTAVSRIVLEGGILAGKALAGHASIRTTETYAHLENSELRNSMERAAAKSPTKSPTAEIFDNKKTKEKR